MLAPPDSAEDPGTPMPTPLLNVAGLRLDVETPQPNAVPPPVSSTPAGDGPTPAAGGADPAGGVEDAGVGQKVEESQAARDAFTKRIQTVFAQIMAMGDVAPNQAAVLALQQVQAKQ